MKENPLVPSIYLVRTDNRALLENGLVGVGWSDFNFSQFITADAAIQAIIHGWGSVRRWGNQIRRYYAIKDGDIVVVPLPYAVAIGKAYGGLLFDESFVDADFANQRRVEFLRDAYGKVLTFPRTVFSEAFQRRLRVQGMAVNELDEFSDEILLSMTGTQNGLSYNWSDLVRTQEKEKLVSFRKSLFDNIQSGKTNLATGGIGLQNLVQELLSVDGYDARVLSTRHFGGYADADVQASRSDRCTVVKLLIQVKHHQGITDEYGLHQLEEIRRLHEGEYDDHEHVLVTSAHVTEDLRKSAAKAGITVIDGQTLVEWIGDSIDQLKPETRLALGIYEVPAVI